MKRTETIEANVMESWRNLFKIIVNLTLFILGIDAICKRELLTAAIAFAVLRIAFTVESFLTFGLKINAEGTIRARPATDEEGEV